MYATWTATSERQPLGGCTSPDLSMESRMLLCCALSLPAYSNQRFAFHREPTLQPIAPWRLFCSAQLRRLLSTSASLLVYTFFSKRGYQTHCSSVMRIQANQHTQQSLYRLELPFHTASFCRAARGRVETLASAEYVSNKAPRISSSSVLVTVRAICSHR